MYFYIVNPAAGGGKINKIQEKMKSRLKELGILGEIVKSIGKGDVEKLTNIAIEKGYKTIVAVGGDGTINEVINGIADRKITLGIIPVGTTNELAKIIGIPDWQSALNILAARKTEVVDLGKIGEKLFVTNISIGFDNFLTDNTNLKEGSVLGKLKFFQKFLGEARNQKSIPVNLEFMEGFKVEADCLNVTVSSGRFLDFLPTRGSLKDNSLDVIILNKLPFGKALKYAKKEEGIDYNYFSVFRTKKVTITTKKPTKVYADGQEVSETPIVAEIADRKLRVIVSRERKF